MLSMFKRKTNIHSICYGLAIGAFGIVAAAAVTPQDATARTRADTDRSAQGRVKPAPRPPSIAKTDAPRPDTSGLSLPAPEAALAAAKNPLVIVVSLRRQRLSVYDRNGSVAHSPISSGNAQFPTITGVFSIIGKSVHHVSNLYEDAEMPFMQRLTWTGTAMHSGHLPGYPASHGCIRLPHKFAQRLYDMTTINTRVIVTSSDAAPQQIDHAKLMAPPISEPIEDAPQVALTGSRVASLAGIGAAYARQRPQPVYAGDLPLSAAARARFAETDAMFEAIRPVEAARNAVAERMKETGRTINRFRVELSRVDSAMAQREESLAKLQRARRTVEGELLALGRRAASARSDDDIDTLSKAEDAIESRLFDLAAEIELVADDIAAGLARRSEIETQLAAAISARAAISDEYRRAVSALSDVRAAFNLKKREDARYMRPVSVLVSRKDQRLYVRQGFEPVLEVPVTFDEPDVPLGTHVYTAMGYRDGGKALDWNVVSLPTRTRDDAARSARNPSTASAALDRITFPPEALAAITERMKPGSSIIISDDGTSPYFGTGTDFTIATR